ncbi:hypothetical protein [Fusobacterium hominis]|uniref:Uncharacterized protein n=1 Tax=Fusobacterium hominis TaxID=2764326 RepID=A0A7G9GXJ5_9FUSO|nr:hypothetical protein [Fusobacterium hominis]QNM15527.1 hypothetical protein H9Q81_01415 [Fusobacterium hominis]
MNNLCKYQSYANQELGRDIYGYSITIDHLCMFVLSVGDNPLDSNGTYSINLPVNYTKNTFFTLVDNDAGLADTSYSNLQLGWVTKNTITYKGVHRGHTIFIIGYIN